jgi:hypothetical protein
VGALLGEIGHYLLASTIVIALGPALGFCVLPKKEGDIDDPR